MSLIKVLLIFVVFLLIALVVAYHSYLVYYFFSKKAPYISSFGRHLTLMKKVLKYDFKGKTMVDLGCGDGKVLRFFVREFGISKGYGYDINWFAWIYGRFLNWFKNHKNIIIYRKSFYKADIGKYDFVYLYLWPEQMHEMEKWIFDNKKQGAIIISNSFQFAKHKPIEIFNNKRGKQALFIYK